MSIKISELPEATAIGNDDLLAIVQEGSTKKITFGNAIGKAQQITVIKQNNSTVYHLDENFTTQLSIPLTEGIYYNDTKPTEGGTIRIITGFENDTYSYTTIPYRSYIVVYPAEKYVWMIDEERYYYKFLVITAGETVYPYGGYGTDIIDIRSYMVTAYVGDWNNKMTCVRHDVENTARKVTTIDDSSTDLQYPSAKAVQDKYDTLLDQIPTATATGETINVQDSSNLPIKEFDLLGNATQANTPNPDYPQDIHVVTGDNTVYIAGDNLTSTSSGNWASGSYDTSGEPTTNAKNARGVAFIPCLPNTQYIIKVSSAVNDLRLSEFDINQSHIQRDSMSSTEALVITTTSNTYYLKWSLNYNNTNNVNQTILDSLDLKLYQITTQLISLGNIELAKIGDYTDRIFKSGDKWYVEKNIGKAVLDGSESWTDMGWTDPMQAYRTTINEIKQTTSGTDNAYVITNYYEAYTFSILNSNDVTNGICNRTNQSQIVIRNDNITSTTDLKTWLSTHNTIVYYVLATPTYTEITDTTLISQLENVLKMHTNKNVTNGWIEPSGTNAQAGLVLTYRKDLETMFDNISNG